MPTNSAILNFDLCDLQKYVKSKTWVLCHVSLLDVRALLTDDDGCHVIVPRGEPKMSL
jgi:hypothetical protein